MCLITISFSSYAQNGLWSANGNGIAYTNRNVGINTDNPLERTHIIGNLRVDGKIIADSLMINRIIGQDSIISFGAQTIKLNTYLNMITWSPTSTSRYCSGAGVGGLGIGNNTTMGLGLNSIAIGTNVKTDCNAKNAIVMGSGDGYTPLINDIPNSLTVGFGTSPTLYVDGNNVGIGTTTPTAKLDINGSVNIDGKAVIDSGIVTQNINADNITLSSLKSSNKQLLQTDANGKVMPFSFSNNSSDVLYGNGIWASLPTVPQSGWTYDGMTAYTNAYFVGIGTTTPTEKLTVQGNGKINGYLIANTLIANDAVMASDAIANRVYAGEFISMGEFKFKVDNQIDAAVIDLNGNFGIGTQTPMFKLDVNGDIHCQTIYADNIQSQQPMEFDSLHVNNKIKVGSSIIIDGYNDGLLANQIYTTNTPPNPDLYIQSKAQDNPWHQGYFNTIINYNNNGKVGIGIKTPQEKLHVNGNIYLTGMKSSLLFGSAYGDVNPDWGIEYENHGLNFFTPAGSEAGTNLVNYKLFLKNNGNVGIATGDPQARLHVNNGYIYVENSLNWTTANWKVALETPMGYAWRITEKSSHADKYLGYGMTDAGWCWILSDGTGSGAQIQYPMKLEIYSGNPQLVIQQPVWADYVFNKDYDLMPIAERKKFIEENNHLPDIKSAEYIAQNGLDVTGTMKGLTKNVEEHELYIQQLYEMIIQLKIENENLKKEIEEIKNNNK